MPRFTLYTRSFHSQTNFGAGGFFYKGDHRDFSVDPAKGTSRIRSDLRFDIEKSGSSTPPINVASDQSQNAVIPALRQPYSEDFTKPHGTAGYEGTPHAPDVVQHVTVTMHHAGQNFAMPGMGPGKSDTDKSEHKDAHGVWKHVVPVLDVFGKLDIVFDPAHKIMKISYVMTGDGFPDCEAFLVDEHGTSVMLATHVRYGSASGQLFEENHFPMAETNIDVEMKPDFSFGDQVTCHKCWDYVDTGAGTIHFEKQFSSGTVGQWNAMHQKRKTQGVSRWLHDQDIGYRYDPNNKWVGWATE